MLTLYVSPLGNDRSNGRARVPGASDGPLATLERASDEIRRIKKERSGLPDGGVTVELSGGTYELGRAFELSAADAGTREAPVLYRAREGEEVRISGGRQLSGFAPVTDSRILARLDPTALGNVVQVDLRAAGISDYGKAGGGGLELFVDDEPMQIARWPNEGFVKITGLVGGNPVDVRGTKGDRNGKFLYEGERPRRWAAEPDAWVQGYWFWDWAEQRHRVESIDPERRIISVEPPYHSYGYRVGQWFYAFNLLSELDRPREWYLDRGSGILYLWPPTPLGQPGQAAARVVVSVIESLVIARDVSHVTFRDLTLEACRGSALVVDGGEAVTVAQCTVRNTGGWAVRMSGGVSHAVLDSRIRGTGQGGVWLSGGDRPTLRPATHRAEGNDIHDYGRWVRMGQPGVSITGVGHVVRRNRIHDAPHVGIFFSGNDHLIEENELSNVCHESNDAGAIYAGRDWTMRGTVIRRNFLHHINGFEGRGCVGVYLDDMFCGTEISQNVFYQVTRAAFIGGGRDCTVTDNVFVDCNRALHIDARAMNWASYHVGTTMTERLQEMPYRNELWAQRYPVLVGILEEEPAAPKGNVVERNTFAGGTWDDVRPDARPYVVMRDNTITTAPQAGAPGGKAP